MILDAQVHIWAENTPERPWAKGMEKRAHLPVPLSAEMLIGLMDEAGVDAAILVPPSLEGGRNDLCLEAARDYPDRFAVMGRLLIDQPEAPELLAQFPQQRGMLGVRLTFHRDNDGPMLTNGAADWIWPELERLGLPAMVHAPDGLVKLAEIAECHPGLRIVIDHMGFARETMDDRALAAADRLLALAKFPNVSVKVSALPCYSSEPYPYRNLHEPLRRIIEGFGVERCFWGTDFSRLPAGCSYRQAVTMFTEELDFLSGKDLEQVMGKSLSQFLGWPAT
ncbi:amidohydrolase family protein [Mesorhizobium sp. CAU 1741]|uniref:amidohydrolase family protein n=1 Tax=Mesorhizobium sp. CAU 1741 TaxID=3140366 RepID=UPI00325A8BBA